MILLRKVIDATHPRDDARRPLVEWEARPVQEPPRILEPIAQVAVAAHPHERGETSKRKKRRTGKEKHRADIFEISEANGDENEKSEEERDDGGFFDASSQMPWAQDFEAHSERVEGIVSSLQASLARIEQTTTNIGNRLDALEKRVARPPPAAVARAARPSQQEALSFTRLSWGSIAFLVAWPLIVLSIHQLATRRRKK